MPHRIITQWWLCLEIPPFHPYIPYNPPNQSRICHNWKNGNHLGHRPKTASWKPHTSNLIMIDVNWKTNSKTMECSLKPHQKSNNGGIAYFKGCAAWNANQIWNFLIFCWHNTTNFNIMPGEALTERGKWSIAGQKGLWTKDQGPSLIFFWADAAASSRSLPLFVHNLNSI